MPSGLDGYCLRDGDQPLLDCIVVGGGPAGLTAAIYLARFWLRVAVIDEGQSRAKAIPLARNHAGFPEGIKGTELLALMRKQAVKYGVAIVEGKVDSIEQEGSDFVVTFANARISARTVLLATGVVNNRPDMTHAAHDEAVAKGLVRYCPICDGFEVSDRRIAVLGDGERGTNEALFLRTFSAHVTLVSTTAASSDQALDDKLAAAGVVKLVGPWSDIAIRDNRLDLSLADDVLEFDTLYPALGTVVRSGLARDLDAKLSDDGSVLVDTHQRTSVAGLYAAGDVVLGLDQISHAVGDGGVAATTIRNDLNDRSPLWR